MVAARYSTEVYIVATLRVPSSFPASDQQVNSDTYRQVIGLCGPAIHRVLLETAFSSFGRDNFLLAMDIPIQSCKNSNRLFFNC